MGLFPNHYFHIKTKQRSKLCLFISPDRIIFCVVKNLRTFNKKSDLDNRKLKSLCPSQYGFRKRRSTADSQGIFTTDICLASSRGAATKSPSKCTHTRAGITMTISDYTKLKESVILAVSKDRDYDNFLSRLKDIFRNEINSARRSEQIRSVADLIQVLEKRYELTDDNVIPLKTIAGAMRSGAELLSLIAVYEQHALSGSALYNSSYYEPTKQVKREAAFSSPHITCKKRSLIYETIACEIGSHWRDLARSLEIREGQIQTIQTECKDFSDRVTRVLEISEHKSDPQKWFYQLCEALETARRKDLRRLLQDIIIMNI